MKNRNMITSLLPYILSAADVTHLRTTRTLANEVQTVANEDALTELNAADPNVVKLPYGRYMHGPPGKQVAQVFNKKAAETMATVQKGGLVEWAKKLITHGWHRISGKQLPVYKGHPYQPGAERTADKSAYGWLTEIVANEDHAEFHFEWTPEGERLIREKAFRYISPEWSARIVGNEAFPFAMVSVGLTNNPNTPCTPLANEDEGASAEDHTEEPAAEAEPEATATTDPLANEAFTRTLRQKLYLDPDATDAQVWAALESRSAELLRVKADVEALRKQYDAEVTARAAVVANESVLREEIATLTAARDQAVTLANEEKAARLNLHLDQWVSEARLPIAERDAVHAHLMTLANDALTTEITKHSTAEPVLKTKPKIDAAAAAREARTATLANEDSGIAKHAQRQAKLLQLRDQIDKQHPNLDANRRHAMAWRELRAQHPELV